MLYYLYEYYQHLDETRNIGMSVNAISFTEIKAFNDMLNLNLSSSEVEIIRMIDKRYLIHYYATQNKAK